MMWLLSGNQSVRTLGELNLAAGHLGAKLPESADAVAIAQASTGAFAVGTATTEAGAVEVRSSTGALAGTVAVGAPVREVTFGSDGVTVYALDGTATSTSVTVVDSQTRTIEDTLPVALDTNFVVASPDGQDLWASERDGTIDELSIQLRRVVVSFSVGQSASSLAISPEGTTLYVLKGFGSIDNVSVVAQAAERVRSVLPAPANCVGIVLSPDGRTLYDAVGTPSVGNVQAFSLAG